MKTLKTRLAVLGFALTLSAPGLAQTQNDPNFINLLDNGTFNIAQRGTTAVSAVTTTARYLWDRWAAYSGTATAVTMTNVTTGLPVGFTNAAQVQRTAAQTGVLPVCLVQEIQSSEVIPLQGQPVTLSFYAAAGANFSAANSILNARIVTGTGTDEGLATLITGFTGAAQAIPAANGNVTLTTAYQRFSVAGVIPATATEAAVQFCFTPVGTAGTSDQFTLTGAQAQRGTIATNFEWRALGVETAKVQRFFYQLTDGAATVSYSSACWVVTANTTVRCGLNLPIPMRAVPVTTISVAASFGIVATAGTAGTCTTLAAAAASNTLTTAGLSCTTGATIALGSATPLIGAATAGTIQVSADF